MDYEWSGEGLDESSLAAGATRNFFHVHPRADERTETNFALGIFEPTYRLPRTPLR
jgi:hypothetical protein